MVKENELVEDKEKIDKLMSIYFNFINGDYIKKALKHFANKEGYGQEIIFIFFQSDLDDYDMEQLSKPLDNKHVLVELGYPAVEVEQQAILDFETFYEHLEKKVNEIMLENADEGELKELLLQVKKNLNI